MGRHSVVQEPDEVKDDAVDRSWRTLWQQLGIDVFIALLLVVYPVVVSAEFSFSRQQLAILGAALLKTLVSTVVSYFYRIYVAPRADDQISLSEAKRVQ